MVCPGKDQFRFHTNGTLHSYENQSTLTLVTREAIAGGKLEATALVSVLIVQQKLEQTPTNSACESCFHSQLTAGLAQLPYSS